MRPERAVQGGRGGRGDPPGDAHGDDWRARWRAPLCVAVIALCARLWSIAALADEPSSQVMSGDGRAYVEWAERIRGGALVGSDVFYQDPLYPYLLAAWRALTGESLTALRVLNAVLGGVAAALLTRAGGALGGARVGVLAGLLLALHPTGIFLDGLVQKTALATCLVCAVLARAATLAHAGTRAVVGLGVLVGLWMLVRGEARLAAALFAAWLGWRRPRALVGYVGGLALAVAPAVAHNVAAGGAWVLTTAQAGPNLYIGNRAGATGTYAPLVTGRGDARREAYDARRLAEEARGHALTAREVSGYWTARTVSEFWAAPSAGLGRLARKARLALSRAELPDTDDFAATVPRSPVLRVLAPLVHMGTLLPLALIGLVLTRRRAAWAPVALIALAQVVALVAFYVFARYRFPLVPCLALFAAEGIVALGPAWRDARRRVAWAFGVAALGAALALWPIPSALLGGEFLRRYQAATALLELGRMAEAERALDALTRDAPAMVEAWTTLGIVRARSGVPSAAVPAFRRALALAPDDPRLLGQLGTALAEAGDLSEAADVLLTAALADPRHPEVSSNAALLQLRLGRTAAALAVLRAHVEAAPDDRGAALQLAWVLATTRDDALRDGAEACARAAPWVERAGVADAAALDVFAAALASSGRFDEAVEAATRARALVRANGDAAHGKSIEAHLERYRAGAPWRE